MSSRSVAGGVLMAAIAMSAEPTLLGQDQDFRCNYALKIECTPAGCTSGDIGSAYLLLPHVDSLFGATVVANSPTELPTIRRCDSKGCSSVVVSASLNGAFINITQRDGTYFLKISTVDLGEGLRLGDFVEVASQMLGTIMYYGSCPAVVK